MRAEIEHAVETIRTRYAEPLSLTELGDEVGLSRFHMARLFTLETGLPPGHFLTAVRLEQARWKLLRSTDSVAAISLDVGYASLGTFTTRFTEMTGVPPGRYRRLSLLGPEARAFTGSTQEASCTYGAVTGRVLRSDGLDDEPVFVAALPHGAHDSRPARCRRTAQSGRVWRLPHVPAGLWSIELVTRSLEDGRPSTAIAVCEPFQVTRGAATHVILRLQSPRQLPRASRPRFAIASQLPDMFAS